MENPEAIDQRLVQILSEVRAFAGELKSAIEALHAPLNRVEHAGWAEREGQKRIERQQQSHENIEDQLHRQFDARLRKLEEEMEKRSKTIPAHIHPDVNTRLEEMLLLLRKLEDRMHRLDARVAHLLRSNGALAEGFSFDRLIDAVPARVLNCLSRVLGGEFPPAHSSQILSILPQHMHNFGRLSFLDLLQGLLEAGVAAGDITRSPLFLEAPGPWRVLASEKIDKLAVRSN